MTQLPPTRGFKAENHLAIKDPQPDTSSSSTLAPPATGFKKTIFQRLFLETAQLPPGIQSNIKEQSMAILSIDFCLFYKYVPTKF